MDSESANCNSHFPMNGHNYNHGPPFEILSEIFSHLASDGPLQLRHVLFVARSWYNAAVYSPNLWTTILIDREFYSRCRNGWLVRGEAFIYCCFIRSRDLPITINLQYQDEGAYDSPLNEAFFSTVVGRLLGSVGHCHTKRCKALTWFSNNSDMDAYAFCKIFPSQLEMLESFSLHSFVPYGRELDDDETLSGLRFPRCPNLKEVSLTDHRETELSRFFHDDDLGRVEKLTFGIISGWMPDDILCISRYRNIHSLTLFDESYFGPDGERYIDVQPMGSTSVHLPRLKALLVIGYIPDYILESIRAPGLLSLRLETDEGSHHTLESIPTTLLTTLISLYISFRPLSTPSWVPLLHPIVSNAPRLSDLFIAGWMKSALEVEDWYRQLKVVCHCL